MKFFKIRDDVYGANIIVITNATKAKILKYFERKYNHQYPWPFDCDAHYYRFFIKNPESTTHFLIFKKFNNTPNSISIFNHELLHLTFSILDLSGIKLSEESEEAYNYYFGYLTEKILEKLC